MKRLAQTKLGLRFSYKGEEVVRTLKNVCKKIGYVSLFSMLIGFVFWYRGLAHGGIAAVGQLQLLQPFMGLMLAATLLGENVSWPMALASAAVVACVAGAKKFGQSPPPRQ